VSAPSTDAAHIVTVVTSDLKGSTSLGERLDPESLREVLTRYFEEMGAVLESHGGVIEKIIGDAIVAVFGLPEARPDDALRAVRAAAETQRTLAALNDQLERQWGIRLTNRTGIATGELVVREATAGEHILSGPVLPLATAMEAGAPANEVLLADSTLAIVASEVTVDPVPDVVPKGGTEAVSAHRLVTVTSDVVEHPVSSPDGTVGADATPVRAGSRQETRKTVTIVFSDIRATTLDDAPLAPEVLRDAMGLAFVAARRALEAHGGTVEKYIGDAVMAVFGLPVRHEDDALRAVRSAVDMQRGLAVVADELAAERGVRLHMATGVNTGEVVAGDARLGQRLVTGDAVNVAARLEQTAPERGVIIGELTYRLVRDAVDVEAVAPLTLKGKAEPVPAYRLLGVRSGAGAGDGRVTRPLIGRENEMDELLASFTEATATRTGRTTTLVGDAGVGKTRLTEEFLAAVSGQARVLRGRCLPYGDGITFWPVVEMVRMACGIAEADPPDVALARMDAVCHDREVTDRVAAAIGLRDTPYQVAELFWGVRRFLEILAANRPVVVLFDDIHWAEATFLELVSHITTTRDAPLLLVCGSRTELLERHPDWGTGDGSRRIVLSPLSDADAGRIAEGLLGSVGLDESVRARIVEAAEGNPLFIEQVLSMLVENGSLREVDGQWEAAADLSRLTIPPTIQALLAARIDRLEEGERAVIDPASIIGQVFPRAALETLVDPTVLGALTKHLRALTSRQLIRPDPADAAAAHRFGHVLIRDTTYEGLLKRTRADLHERFVAWADEANRRSDRATEFEEILGYHLEQAHRYRTQLGPLDEHGEGLGVEASRRLASAGERAFVRGDLPASTNLIGRAAALLPDGDARRPALLCRLAEARMNAGEYDAAIEVLQAAERTATELLDEAMVTRARLQSLLIRYLTGTGDDTVSPEPEVRAGIAVLERLGDHRGLADAWSFIGNLRIADGRWSDATDAITQVVDQATRAGDEATVVRMGAYLAFAAFNGPTPIPEVISLCEDLLTRTGGDRKAEAQILRVLAHAHAMRGEFALARDEYRRARRDLDELGWTFQAAVTSIDSGAVELLAGDPVAAEAEYRRDYEALDALGERNYITTISAYLAGALYDQGRWSESATHAAFSAEVAAADDVVTQFLWRQVTAKLAAREGDVAQALTLAREALELTRQSDDLVAQADALSDLASIMTSSGMATESADARIEALRLYERKGDVVSAAALEVG
jgi:class 3 adenylate cyclase/tetratricopeptide (TPR) repeat protein